MGCICDAVRLKRSAKVLPMQECNKKPPMLTKTQIAVIRNTWNIIKMYFATVGINTFICLFESRPELQESFKEFRGRGVRELRMTGLLRKHSLRVMTTIDKCIIHVDEPSYVIPLLTQLGLNHAKNEVPAEYVESILPPFLNAIKPYIENLWCSDLEDAWRIFFSWMIFYIKEGMSQNCDEQ